MIKKVTLAIFILIGVAHLYVSTIGQDRWPISRYSMFSEPHIKMQYPLLGFYAVLPGNREILLNYDKRFSINHFSTFSQISPQFKNKTKEQRRPILTAILKWYNEMNQLKAVGLRIYRIQPAYDLHLGDIANLRKLNMVDEVAIDN